MTQCACGTDATFVDERPGASTVGWCRQHLPVALRSRTAELTPTEPPKPAGDVQPTPAGDPEPVDKPAEPEPERVEAAAPADDAPDEPEPAKRKAPRK